MKKFFKIFVNYFWTFVKFDKFLHKFMCIISRGDENVR